MDCSFRAVVNSRVIQWVGKRQFLLVLKVKLSAKVELWDISYFIIGFIFHFRILFYFMFYFSFQTLLIY